MRSHFGENPWVRVAWERASLRSLEHRSRTGALPSAAYPGAVFTVSRPDLRLHRADDRAQIVGHVADDALNLGCLERRFKRRVGEPVATDVCLQKCHRRESHADGDARALRL